MLVKLTLDIILLWIRIYVDAPKLFLWIYSCEQWKWAAVIWYRSSAVLVEETDLYQQGMTIIFKSLLITFEKTIQLFEAPGALVKIESSLKPTKFIQIFETLCSECEMKVYRTQIS